MKPALALALITLAALPAHAAGPHDGVYGVVCFDPSKGEMKGSRVILSGAPAKPEVVFQHCTGGCSVHRTVSATLAGDDLAFEIASRSDDTKRASFSGRFRAGALNLEGHTDSYGFNRQRLTKTQRCPRDTVLADP